MTLPRKSLLVFVEGISFGHTARSLMMARWLKSLPYSITVACSEATAGLFEQEGLSTRPLHLVHSPTLYQRLCQGQAMYQTEDLLNYFQQDDQLIHECQPDLILAEFRFTALQLAKKYQIPSVGMTDATCHPHFRPEGTVPDPFAQPRFMPLGVLDFLSQKTLIGQQMNRQTIRKLSEPYQKASESYGVEVLPSFFDYASQGNLCLLCDHPDLIPLSPLRSGDLYTGALLWERSEPLPPELPELLPDKTVIYVSLGTQESLSTDFLMDYLQQLLSDDRKMVIVSLGKRSLKLTSERQNLRIYDFLNDHQLLPYVDVMVYPGGAMSTYQALASGVSLIALPAHANQHFYAEAIARNHLGYFFRPSRLKIDTLVTATSNILENSQIQQSVRAFKQKLLTYQPKELILERIDALMNGNLSSQFVNV